MSKGKSRKEALSFKITAMDYLQLHQQFKEGSVSGRYITLRHIEPLLAKYQHEVIGSSVQGRPIYKLQFGTGKTKILMWSQMHGNESTTTKALFDFINLAHSETDLGKKLQSEFTFCLLPMLNPDGSELYTRENANEVDLNRDAQNLSQPESIVLRKTFDEFKPDYCYNLHDQRTIYGVGQTNNPATVSFLSPSYNESRDINEVRTKAMNVIVAMNEVLQQYIPNQVGRFDDSFNFNCVGDTFQYFNAPTILFEAGHFPNDYEREITRKYIFIALISGLQFFYENDIVLSKIEDYLKIPQNKVVFYDFVYKNVKINYDNIKKSINFASQFKEILNKGEINFKAHIARIDGLEQYFGHVEVDAEGGVYRDDQDNFPEIDASADFILGNIKIVNGSIE